MVTAAAGKELMARATVQSVWRVETGVTLQAWKDVYSSCF
jgi:hypothetical protein